MNYSIQIKDTTTMERLRQEYWQMDIIANKVYGNFLITPKGKAFPEKWKNDIKEQTKGIERCTIIAKQFPVTINRQTHLRYEFVVYPLNG